MKSSFLLLVLVLSILAGCISQPGKNGEKRIAALVNGKEITEREVDYLYMRASDRYLTPDESHQLRIRILADLVRTELLAQKAEKSGLQKNADYAIALYNAQKKVMAEMAEFSVIKGLSDPDKKDITDVIANNPRFFSGRKLFVYDELMMSSTDTKLLTQLDNKINSGETLEDIQTQIKKLKINHIRAIKAVTSDKLPLEMYSALIKMQLGKPQIIRVENRFSFIIELHNRFPAVIDGKNAELTAARILRSKNAEAAINRNINEIVNNSQITYYGDYARKDIRRKALNSELPVPDKFIVARQKAKKIALGGILSASFLFSVLIVTAGMHIVKGESWIPRLVPHKKDEKKLDQQYEIPLEIHVVHKLFLVITGVIVLLFLSANVMYIMNVLPLWGILVAIVFGIISGILSSKLFRLNFLSELSDNVYIFVIILLTIPLPLFLLLIVRYSNV